MMPPDDATELQLNEFANGVRRALAAEIAIVIASGPAAEGDKLLRTQCGVSSRHHPATRQAAQQQLAEVTMTLLRCCDAVVMRQTGGKCRILVQSGSGPLPLGDINVERYHQTMEHS